MRHRHTATYHRTKSHEAGYDEQIEVVRRTLLEVVALRIDDARGNVLQQPTRRRQDSVI